MTNSVNSNVVWHPHHLTKSNRSNQKQQKPCIIWFTGLSGSGKSTLANAVEVKLFERQKHTYLLDGDNVRHGINRGLGFTEADRIENIRRVGELAKLFVDAGLVVLTAFISPYSQDRQMVRNLVEADEFIEVYVNTPLYICEQRDPKGLYKKARAGQLKHFTGVDSPYEAPTEPELIIQNYELSIDDAANQIIGYLETKGYI